MYKQCEMGKMMKSIFKRKAYCSNDILELVQIYLCAPNGVQRYYADKYFILFVDEFSRMMTMMFLKERFDAFQIFKWYLDSIKKETGKSLKFLRSNRGGKFILDELNIFYNGKGIKKNECT